MTTNKKQKPKRENTKTQVEQHACMFDLRLAIFDVVMYVI